MYTYVAAAYAVFVGWCDVVVGVVEVVDVGVVVVVVFVAVFVG